MKNTIQNLIRSAVFAALFTSTATFAAAADKAASESNPGVTSVAPTASSPRAYPFRGTVGTADATAKTVGLAGRKSTRLLHVDASTKLSRDGKDITVAELQSGDYVKGLLLKTDGRETLVKATVGEPSEPKTRARRSSNGKRRTTPTAQSMAE